MFKNALLLFFIFNVVSASGQERLNDNVFFVNSRMDGSYYYSNTNYTSGSWIKNNKHQLPVSKDTFNTPGNALQFQFVNSATGSWSVELKKPDWRGQDRFKEAELLSFAIYIAPNITLNDLPSVAIKTGDSTTSTPVSLSSYISISRARSWTLVRIPLTAFGLVKFKHASEIQSIVFRQNSSDGKEHNFYLDDVELVPISTMSLTAKVPAISKAKGYAKHVDLEWPIVMDSATKYIKIYRSNDGEDFKPVGVQNPGVSRYADFVGETGKTYSYKISLVGYDGTETVMSAAVLAKTKAMTDDELLTMVQEATFRYYWEGAEAVSGLAKENISGRTNMVAIGASGFGVMALITGTERKFITREQAVERFLKIVNWLEKAETFHGAFSHFIDGPTGKVETFFGKKDNGGDLVETSFLMQGLIAARAYFNKADSREKQIRDKITTIWNRVEWDWYRKEPESKFLTWHWSPDQGWVINHQLIGWNETMVTYLLAIASPTHSVPPSLYYSGWANQENKGQQYRKNWGKTSDGSLYTNENTYYGVKLDVGVSNGGPLFFTHYSYLGFDPHAINDAYTNYFTNNRNIALINYRYCTENPGGYIGYSDSCWGLTASDNAYGYMANEPVLKMDNGKITPTASVSSMPYTPTESMKALRNFYYNYGSFLWGEFGFRDAFNLTQNWCSDIYMGLNQAPMTVMIENYRTGLVWKLFMSDPEMQKALNKIRKK